VSRLLKLTD